MATILIDKNVMVPMRDGMRLATDVCRLEGATPAPVLLARTPYNKEHAAAGAGGVMIDLMRAVQAGYVVVVQDVRGRYASEGEFHPHVQETRISGWYDIFLWATFQNYQGMRQRGGTEHARRNQRVIIGPWTHSNFTGSFPEREFGPAASGDALDLTGLHLRWFDRWLKGADNGVDREPPVMIFVMGIDTWRAESDWPLPDTRYRPYYLRSGGQSNTLHGDGALSAEPRGDEPPDVYLVNPLRPVPTVGGHAILPGANAMGPRDQRAVEARDDVLMYSTPALDRPVEVTGPIELRLFAASSARDTDFTGKLVDVYPDGRAITLTEGILRARYRTSSAAPELLEPDAVYELRLDLWATANVVLPGHRIRLEVSSSNFPRFSRNSNTGGEIASESAGQYRPAINRVFHDAAHPSRLILPIIER